MTGKISRGRLLASTFMVGSLAFAAPAIAQDTQQAPIAPPAAANNPAPPPAAPPGATATPGVSSANGQSAAATGGEIIVTGSRIPHPELESTSPVTVVGSQEVKLTGTTRTEDLLNALPQVFAGQGSAISNGSTGTATIDLRGLGTKRTLVLVNGRRLVPGDPSDPVADINIIPSTMIKRVDVLTGGASSVYGADAVSGVVNFVMDTDFDGFSLDSQYSIYNHDNNEDTLRAAHRALGYGYPTGQTVDGGGIDTSVKIGAGFDDGRGHVTAYAGYRKINAVTQDQRDYSSCSISANDTGGFDCGGSGTSAQGKFKTVYGSYYVQGDQFIQGSKLYNYAPTNYYQRPDERYTAGFFAHYDVNDNFKPYMEFMFMDDHTVAQIAASGDFGNTSTINCDNPLLSDQQYSLTCTNGNYVGQILTHNDDGTTTITGTPTVFTDASGHQYEKAYLGISRRNVEGGGRQDDLQHTTYRGVIGAKGDIARGISYDAYYQYSRVNYAETYYNDFSVNRLNRALDVVNVLNGAIVGRDTPGATPTCRSTFEGTDPSCVPYNIFTTGGVNSAALGYLQTPGFQRGHTSEQVADANVTFLGSEYGIQSPWANEGVALNIGAEYRKESLALNVDQEFSTGDLAGQGGARIGVSGSFNVKEVFAELSVPLVQDRPFFQNLTFDAGYRRSHYETAAGTSYNTDTWKLQGEWAPIRDIKVRGGYNRAVRAPNVVELFSQQNVVLDGTHDYCAGGFDDASHTTVNGYTFAQCARSGVTQSEFGHIDPNPASQYNGQVGGNPNLKPEVSDSWTVGAVLTPTFLRGFSATVDYFHIKVKDEIGTIGADTILKQCITNDVYCDLIHRNQNPGPNQGSLYLPASGVGVPYIVDTLLNAGSVKTDGIDVTAAYTQELGSAGTLGFSLVGTYLRSLKYAPVGVTPYNCTGYFGVTCGTPNPKWRHKLRLTYTAPSGPSVSLAWRYFSKVDFDGLSSNPTMHVDDVPAADAHIKAQSYFDLAFTVPVADKFTFRLGAQNLLDKAPPLIGVEAGPGVVINGNTFPQVYDALGRYLYAGVTFDL